MVCRRAISVLESNDEKRSPRQSSSEKPVQKGRRLAPGFLLAWRCICQYGDCVLAQFLYAGQGMDSAADVEVPGVGVEGRGSRGSSLTGCGKTQFGGVAERPFFDRELAPWSERLDWRIDRQSNYRCWDWRFA